MLETNFHPNPNQDTKKINSLWWTFFYPLGRLKHDDLQIIFAKANEEKEQNIKLTTIVTFEFSFLEPLTLLVQQAPGNYDPKNVHLVIKSCNNNVHHAFELHLCIYILIILKVLKNPEHKALVVCWLKTSMPLSTIAQNSNFPCCE